jgi:4'-phosphopantetheinyl transferase superfamily protein
VECVKTGLDFLGLGEGQLGAEEIARLRSLSEQERALAFYRSWTRHEAMAKATGRGIASPSDQDGNDSFAPTPRLAVSRLSEHLLSPWTWPRNERKIPGACGNQPPAAEYSFECSLGGVFAIGALALCPPRQQPVQLEMPIVGRGEASRW